MQINKYTGRPFSAKFWSILEKRRALPVWDYYNKFMETVKSNSAVVLVGETGSGKTTQVCGGGAELAWLGVGEEEEGDHHHSSDFFTSAKANGMQAGIAQTLCKSSRNSKHILPSHEGHYELSLFSGMDYWNGLLECPFTYYIEPLVSLQSAHRGRGSEEGGGEEEEGDEGGRKRRVMRGGGGGGGGGRGG